MFLNQSILNKLMKEAYKTGLRVWRSSDEIYIGGVYWSAIIKEGFLPKETKGNLISLVGELPDPGTGFKAYKDGNQMELPTGELFTPESSGTPLEVTNTIQIGTDGAHQRLLQDADTGELYLINNIFVSIISPEQICVNEGEYRPGKPMLIPARTSVKWQNNVCTFNALLRRENNENGILERLKGVDLMMNREAE